MELADWLNCHGLNEITCKTLINSPIGGKTISAKRIQFNVNSINEISRNELNIVIQARIIDSNYDLILGLLTI